MDARRELGRRGEDAAADLYRRLGFTVVARNFRCARGEIDVIARNRELIVFCEVKLRTSSRFGLPAEGLRPAQMARIRRAAAYWLASHRRRGANVRFDVVSVIVRGAQSDMTHIPNAF